METRATTTPVTSLPEANEEEQTQGHTSDPNSPVDPTVQERIDEWIRVNELNEYGDPIDTTYLGGTPLFDEETGALVDRYVYIIQRHPELAPTDTDPNMKDSPLEESTDHHEISELPPSHIEEVTNTRANEQLE